ncbi:TonB-dependent receptor domain-containing protein [Morganella morganii]|uniref:TonB-dependent receptor domain-containing protein n=1 Tax=Morganella morganii TaxID=582 RepID=UPI003EBC4CE0
MSSYSPLSGHPPKTITLLLPVLFIPLPGLAAEEKNQHLGDITLHNEQAAADSAKDKIYDKNVSTLILTKEEIERYKGASAADILKGANGVFSGDARNGNALDVNIRGIQGPGRVPVTIDGTEQAVTVYRGYNGANNRNYLDPMLISEIEIEKGPSLNPLLKTSVGGGVAMKTLTINDVVKNGEQFGAALILENSSNTTKARIPNLGIGEDYRLVDNMQFNWFIIDDPGTHLTPENRDNAPALNNSDYAWRLAVGTRQENMDLLLAYAYRDRGNYFAGKRHSENYNGKISKDDIGILHTSNKTYDPYMPFVSRIYRKGNEVPNTSAKTESWLIKNTWYLNDDHALQLSWRDTRSDFGDIMPSRLGWIRAEDNIIPQWPLADLHAQAGYLHLKSQPAHLAYIDADIRLWTTLTTSNTNSGGGWPRYPKNMDYGYKQGDISTINPAIDGTLINTAALNVQNQRYGLDFSNKFAFTPELSVTLAANMQFEHLDSSTSMENYKLFMFAVPARKGRRFEYQQSVSLDWQPVSWLSLSAGGRQTVYWSVDDLSNECAARKDPYCKQDYEVTGYYLNYFRNMTETESQAYKKQLSGKWNEWTQEEKETISGKIFQPVIYRDNPDNKAGRMMVREKKFWQVDTSDGRLKQKDRPDIDTTLRGIDPYTGKETYLYEYGSLPISAGDRELQAVTHTWKEKPRRQASAWTPMLSASVHLTDDLRLYGRYAETVRMPSLFEDTIGFSGMSYPHIGYRYKPERAVTHEYGVVFNGKSLLHADRHADIRLNYFHTDIHNVFDRDNYFRFTQMDKQILKGIEIQARYDHGWVFSDLGVTYNLTNKVCDETSHAFMDPTGLKDIPSCIDGGYPGGFLRTQIQPHYSVTFNLGGRLLQESLEIGSRWLYHSAVENSQEKRLMTIVPNQYSNFNNYPMRWNSVLTVDAYAKYKITPDVALELTATNLTNEYYLDPLTRSMMPAPGRAVKFNVSARF